MAEKVAVHKKVQAHVEHTVQFETEFDRAWVDHRADMVLVVVNNALEALVPNVNQVSVGLVNVHRAERISLIWSDISFDVELDKDADHARAVLAQVQKALDEFSIKTDSVIRSEKFLVEADAMTTRNATIQSLSPTVV